MTGRSRMGLPTKPNLKKPTVVFAAGCFNRVHQAHVRLLSAARLLGDRLVVVLSNDAHNHKPNAAPAAKRIQWVRDLKLADQVLVGSARGFAGTLRKINPDVLILGYDQKLPDADTRRVVRERGIDVVVMPWFPGKEETVIPQ